MQSKRDITETMIKYEADEVTKELFKSLKNSYLNNLEWMKDSEFLFHYGHFLYCKCHKKNPNRGGSYLNSPVWIKNKNATITKMKKEGINFASKKDDSKKFEKNILTIPLNVLYIKKEKIYPAYVLKNNSNHQN